MAKITVSSQELKVGMASFLGMMVSVYPILISPFGVFLQPVSKEFGWGRDVMPTALFIATTTVTCLYPIVGRLLDRFGPRAILLPGFAFFGLAVCALSQISKSTALLYGLFMIAGACSALPTGMAFARLISRNFVENRGLVLGICLGVGGGAGAALAPLAAYALIDQFGWRAAYIGLGMAPLLIGLPITYFYVRTPKAAASVQDTYEFGLTLPQAAGQASFWILVAGIFIINIMMGGIIGHFVAMATDRGVSERDAAGLLSLASVATLAGQFAIGLALDRVRTPILIFPVLALLLMGLTIIHHSTSTYLLALGIILMGLGAGSEYGLLPYFITRFFGLKTFGQLYGIIYASSSVSFGFGPVFMGYFY